MGTLRLSRHCAITLECGTVLAIGRVRICIVWWCSGWCNREAEMGLSATCPLQVLSGANLRLILAGKRGVRQRLDHHSNQTGSCDQRQRLHVPKAHTRLAPERPQARSATATMMPMPDPETHLSQSHDSILKANLAGYEAVRFAYFNQARGIALRSPRLRIHRHNCVITHLNLKLDLLFTSAAPLSAWWRHTTANNLPPPITRMR